MSAAFDKTELDITSEAIAARLPASVGLDPVLILSILSQILPLLTNCGANRAEGDPEKISEFVRDRVARGPKSHEKLRRNIARRVRGQATETLTVDQSLTMADAIIAEAMDPVLSVAAQHNLLTECQALDPYREDA